MDLFRRRRGEWVKKVKVAGAEAVANLPLTVVEPAPLVEDGEDGDGEVEKKTGEEDKKGKGKKKKNRKAGKDPVPDPTKSAIQLAREKFAAAKAAKSAMKSNKGTGVNASVVAVGK